MHPLKEISINFALEVARTKNIPALGNLFNCWYELIGGDEKELGSFMQEVATLLACDDMSLLEWYLEALIEIGEQDEEDEDEAIYEEEVVLKDYLDLIYNEPYIDRLNKADIIHLLLDSGFVANRDFEDRRCKISVTSKARAYLSSIYLEDMLNPILCKKDKSPNV